MSLPHAILALLELEQGSGYDLVKRFNKSIGFFWSASHQQVYKELAKLSEKGWVTFETVSQEDKPDKKVYRLTEAGQEELAAWGHKPAPSYRFKDPLLIKLFAGALTSETELLEELARQESRHRETLAFYRHIEAQVNAAGGHPPPAYQLPYLTMRLGVRFEEAWLEWLEEVRGSLNSVPFRSVGSGEEKD